MNFEADTTVDQAVSFERRRVKVEKIRKSIQEIEIFLGHLKFGDHPTIAEEYPQLQKGLNAIEKFLDAEEKLHREFWENLGRQLK